MKTKYKAVLRSITTPSGNEAARLILPPNFKARNLEHFYLVPATPAAYDAQVEAMAKSCYKHGDWLATSARTKSIARLQMQIALAAIGITRPKGAKEGEKTL